MAKLRAGIIGFGLAGRNMHYRALAEGLGDIVEVTAVWTRRPVPRAGTVPDDFPAKDTVAFYTSLDEFLAHPGLDVVHITTPSGLHRDYIIRAAAAGKHIICDKPLEVTVDAIDQSIEACRKAGVALSVNFQQRFNPHVARLKDAVERGCLGDIVAGSVEAKLYRAPEYYSGSSWHGRLALDGGAALMNQGIHYIDLVQWLMKSPPVRVVKGIAGRLVHTGIEAEDFGYGEIMLANGAEMTILGGTCFRPGIDQRFEIRGTNGHATVVDGIVTQACWDGADRREYFGAVEKVAFSGGTPMMGLDNHERYFRAFYTALADGGEAPVPGEEARAATELILGIYKAQETGKPVDFPIEADYHPGF
jgi:predicted dehydrogenase